MFSRIPSGDLNTARGEGGGERKTKSASEFWLGLIQGTLLSRTLYWLGHSMFSEISQQGISSFSRSVDLIPER